MDKARKGEIAMLFLKHHLKKRGVELNPSFKREVGNMAKATGVPFDEAFEFTTSLMREVVEEIIGDAKKNPSSVDED